jgi:hypothetical protein
MTSHLRRHPFRSGCLLLVLLVGAILGLYAMPNPPSPDPFQSGGLGLPQHEWEQQHRYTNNGGFDYPLSSVHFYDADLSVYFWPEGWLNLDGMQTTGISSYLVGDARGYSHKFLPVDAQLQRTIPATQPDGLTVEIYCSASLATRYPWRPFAPDPWRGKPPGTFYVTYANHFALYIPAHAGAWLLALDP